MQAQWAASDFEEFMESEWVYQRKEKHMEKRAKENASDRRRQWWANKLELIRAKKVLISVSFYILIQSNIDKMYVTSFMFFFAFLF